MSAILCQHFKQRGSNGLPIKRGITRTEKLVLIDDEDNPAKVKEVALWRKDHPRLIAQVEYARELLEEAQFIRRSSTKDLHVDLYPPVRHLVRKPIDSSNDKPVKEEFDFLMDIAKFAILARQYHTAASSLFIDFATKDLSDTFRSLGGAEIGGAIFNTRRQGLLRLQEPRSHNENDD